MHSIGGNSSRTGGKAFMKGLRECANLNLKFKTGFVLFCLLTMHFHALYCTSDVENNCCVFLTPTIMQNNTATILTDAGVRPSSLLISSRPHSR